MRILDLKIVVLVFASVFVFCNNPLEDLFKDPETNPVRNVLKTTMPLAYASNLAMEALNGNKASNVRFVKGGDSSIGSFLMEITVDNNMPLPQGIQASGYISVAGVIARKNVAIMSIVFTRMNITRGVFSISTISTIPVVQDSDLVTGKKRLFVVYSDLDLNGSTDTLVNIDMSKKQTDNEYNRYDRMKTFDNKNIIDEKTFIIVVDNNNTLTDVSDDNYVVSGGGNYIEAESSSGCVEQIIIAALKMSPDCKMNPTSGFVAIQELQSGNDKVDIGFALLNSNNSCDGTMKITAATGNYIKSNGKSVQLDLSK